MTRDDFWKLIKSINRSALAEGDENSAIAPLEDMLGKFRTGELESFEEHLSQCLYALDGRAYAEQAGESGDSDDAFLYARCYVVAQGEAAYQATLENPALMPKTLDQWCEALLYPHHRVWAKLTGAEESDWSFDASVSYETGSNDALWS